MANVESQRPIVPVYQKNYSRLWTFGRATRTRNDSIPYITLEHSIFGIYQLAFEPFLIIRQEYYDFMTDIIAEVENGQVKEYFLTGQPGNIGK